MSIRLNYGENLIRFDKSFKRKIIQEIVNHIDDLNLYPDKFRDLFIIELSKYHNVSPSRIISGTGIKGILDL